jgi:hypothetical protein
MKARLPVRIKCCDILWNSHGKNPPRTVADPRRINGRVLCRVIMSHILIDGIDMVVVLMTIMRRGVIKA